jgi:hypothetical protein
VIDGHDVAFVVVSVHDGVVHLEWWVDNVEVIFFVYVDVSSSLLTLVSTYILPLKKHLTNLETGPANSYESPAFA